ncbi:hypothetical protein FEM48_Zijuj03G0152600 [Ziziphus jujuba var. spinosa]|uniref:MBD domain-containing protein n=1 Tax=Ziziphus jujuba var. spinosa TaxID=714518 RepID=A0A978VR22_ZIZJJ|nr:hypothetical protein FEM48_Zijuj03G0152600 [Ziziphus jujuba var. spinosa]
MAETEDWLPPGWTVEVKIRNNGRKDKYYHAPLDGPKFNSKAEVSRYLSSKQIIDGKGTFKRFKRNVVVEKVIPKGLPPGWIKEIRMTKKAGKIRRDPYYIDPINGKIFRSMKDVYRYLETEELGSLGKKLKGSSDEDLEYDETSSPVVSKGQKLAVGKTRRQIDFSQSSNSNEMLKDEQIPNSTFTGQCQFPLEHTSDQGRMSNELRNSDIQEAKVSEQELQSNSPKSTLASFPAGDVLQGEQSPECVLAKHERGRTRLGLSKSKAKKETNLPRRASKRLAGLEVDPIPELKPKTRARRSAVKQSGDDGVNQSGSSSTPGSDCAFEQPDQLEVEPETYCIVDTSESTELPLQSNKRRRLPVDLVTPEKQVSEAETGINCDDRANEKLELPIELPLGELLTDPCIAFAIKTLTGVAFDTYKSSEVASAGSNSRDHSSGNLVTPIELAGNVETGKEAERELGPSVVLPMGVLSFPERQAGKIDTDKNADEKSGYPIEFPSSCSWLDPCIEFAIKTLTTDAVPDIQNYFQQQLSSSNSQEHSSDLSMKNVGLHNFSQTNVLHPQFYDVEKPVLEQQVLVEHTLPQSRNISIPSSRASSQNHHGRGRH